MTIDAYTKTILTIIALCLMWICVRDVPLLSAADPPLSTPGPIQAVKIVGVEIEGLGLPVSLVGINVANPESALGSKVRWVPIGGTVRVLDKE